MSDEQTVPDVIYLNPHFSGSVVTDDAGLLETTRATKSPSEHYNTPYLLCPDNDPTRWQVCGFGVTDQDAMEIVALKHDLAAAEQKYAALSEAALNTERGSSVMSGDLRALKQLAESQQDQPAGEWITVTEDWTSLPKHQERGWWLVAWSDSSSTWHQFPLSWRLEPDVAYSHAVAYWSIPHIVHRPDIPPYQQPETASKEQE